MRVNSFGTRAYTYRQTSVPSEFPISLQRVRSYLKLKSSADDDLLNILIAQATDFAEKFTRRVFISRNFETFRDFFPQYCNSEGYYLCGDIPGWGSSISTVGSNLGFEIRVSPLESITSIAYLKENVSTLVDPSIYYSTRENDYSEILTLPNQVWPQDADKRLQAITISFIVGYGINETAVPIWVKEGILQHIAFMYENRGDCVDSSSGNCDCLNFLPATSKAIYLQNKIHSL